VAARMRARLWRKAPGWMMALIGRGIPGILSLPSVI
jgi:hypothetical protein